MIEGSANSIPISDLKTALSSGSNVAERIATHISALAEAHARPKRKCSEKAELDPNVKSSLIRSVVRRRSRLTAFMCYSVASKKLEEIYTDESHHKISRDEAVSSLKGTVMNALRGEHFGATNRKKILIIYFQRNILKLIQG